MMTNQILDRRTIGIPGADGDITAEAAEARDQAVSAAAAAAASEASAGADAERAEDAADSIDMSAINLRLDGIETTAESAVQTPAPAPSDKSLLVYDAAQSLYVPATVGEGIVMQGSELVVDDSLFATRAYADAKLGEASEYIEDVEENTARLQDLFTVVRLDNTLSGGQAITGAAEHSLFIAPFELEITSIDLVFDNEINIGGTTNSFLSRIVKRPNSGASAVNVVTKSTQAETIGGSGNTNRRKRWSMTNGTWGNLAARTVPSGDNISWVIGSVTGSINIPMGLSLTIGYRPVR